MNGRYQNERAQSWAIKSAVHYLSRYASSAENLRRTMIRRAGRKFEDITEKEAAELADWAVRFCSEQGFLNDSAYAETKTAAGVRKGFSKRKIAASLSAKGVNSEVLENALAEVDDLKSAIVYAKRKRIGPFGGCDQKGWQKQAAALARQGFQCDIAFKVARMGLQEANSILLQASVNDEVSDDFDRVLP